MSIFTDAISGGISILNNSNFTILGMKPITILIVVAVISMITLFLKGTKK